MSRGSFSPFQGRRAEWLLLAGFLFLLVNSAYVGAFAAPTLIWVGSLFLHIVLGVLLLLPFLLIGWGHVRAPGIPASARAAAIAGYLALAGSAAAGIYLLKYGALRAHLPVVRLHVALGVAAAVGWGLYLASRATREAPEGGRFRPAWRATATAGAAALLVFAGIRLYVASVPRPLDVIRNPERPPVEMARESMGGSAGPFFPSSAHTTTGGRIPSTFFMAETSETCSRSGCHADIYQQWFSSAHHFSSFNNQWYRKSIEYMQDMVGTRPSKWCGGCHDPAVLFNGMMDTPIKEILHRPEAQAGLGCTACHSIIQVRSSMGQGDYLIEYPPLHDLAVSKNRVLRAFHDFMVEVNPEPHRRVFLKPFHREQAAEFCSSCHKVHLDVPVNNYRWFRGFNDYDNWQASAVSGQGARSFYYPPQPSTCVTCHMPLVPSQDKGNHDGLVHSHRFPGANTALPTANQDEKQLKTVTDFLTDRRVTLDLFAVTEPAPLPPPAARRPAEASPSLSSFFAVGEEQATGVGAVAGAVPATGKVHAPLDRLGPVAAPGESVRVDLVVRTRGVGHFFPGGTVDAFDVWTELQAVDADGKVLLWSGYLEDGGKGRVDPSAHFYKSLMLDAKGNLINKRNAWAGRAILYVNLIPPGAADTVHYRLDLPADVKPPVRLSAKLNYRKFAWWNTHWAFAGVRDPAQPDFSSSKDYDDGGWVFTGDTSDVSGKLKEIPDLPVVILAKAEAELKIRRRGDPPPPEPEPRPEDRERWNDYGIGLLLQGDLRGAEAAFRTVTRIEPGYADGWLNAARALIAEGDLDAAQTMLDEALKRGPDLARAHFFQGEVSKSRGEYSKALDHYRRAQQSYPRDRVVLNAIGRVLFLQEKHAEAVAELKKVMQIDPEDLQAHYTLMLAYGALGQKPEAEAERRLYLRFKANESAQEITGAYRRDHPYDNNERQRIHEHLSRYPAGAAVREVARSSAAAERPALPAKRADR
ncbi:MAG TPA: tetratricopeptide repeat protein [Candidatus Polarisedimenticolia bacterium]|jgi:Flp pilus assembly protein TadD|nr:tetratricopeptide repeat protein [Candidatus Polarisedimenticolia bacterium]